MRGVRGGLRDQVRAFFKFLLKRKKKREKEFEIEKLKSVKSGKKEVSHDLGLLNEIVELIVNDEIINYELVNKEISRISKKKENIFIQDKIEEVKERVELEVLYEEISSKPDFIKTNEVKRFISLSSNFINNSNDTKEVNHYSDMVMFVYDNHSKNALEKNKKIVQEEEQLVVLCENKKKELEDNVLFIDDFIESYENVEADNVYEDVSEFESSMENKDEVKFDFVDDNVLEENLEISLDDNVSVFDDFVDNNDLNSSIEYDANSINSDDKLESEIDEVEQKSFDYSDFEFIKQLNVSQILISETVVNDLNRDVSNIKNLFTDKGFFERFFEFSSNMFSLGRGLINKYIFKDRLVRRINSDIIINNSLKGIHRAFSDDKKEIPYLVFKDFENEINSKRDCAIKIGHICDDSLSEVVNIRNDFFKRYSGSLEVKEVADFLNQLDYIENTLNRRKAEINKIKKRVEQQYKLNYQKIKVIK